MDYDNLLFICLDACRYDNFKEASTPNFDKIGELRRVYSETAGTGESFLSFMYGCPPFGLPDDIVDSGYWMDYRDPNCIWKRKKQGYTLLLTGNRCVLEIANLFKDKFDKIEFKNYKKPGQSITLSSENIFNDFIEMTKDKDKFHTILWLMETHHPYSTDKVLPYNHILRSKIWRHNQIQSIEYIDKIFGNVVDYLKKRDDKTLVIILADHGDMQGENVDGKQRWHHSVFNKQHRCTFHEKMFEIPYIQGVI